MLTNSLKISDTSKIKIFELISFQSDQNIWQKYYSRDLMSVLESLTCWLFLSVLRQGFLGI